MRLLYEDAQEPLDAYWITHLTDAALDARGCGATCRLFFCDVLWIHLTGNLTEYSCTTQHTPVFPVLSALPVLIQRLWYFCCTVLRNKLLTLKYGMGGGPL